MSAFRTCILAVCFLASSGPEVGAQPEAPPAAGSRASTEDVLSEQVPATLTVWNRPLAVFRAPVGGRSPQQRAEAAAARVESALDRLRPGEIRYEIVESESLRAALIMSGEGLLFGVLEGDLPQDTANTLETAGAQAVERLEVLVRERTDQRRWRVLLRSSVEALVATLAFAGVWLASRRTLQWLRDRLAHAASRRIKAKDIAGIDPRPLVFSTLGWLMQVVEIALRLVAAYLWLTFVLSRFAYSRPWGQKLGGFLIDTVTRMAASVVDHLPNLITLAIILVVTRTIARAVGAWFSAVQRGDLRVSWLDPVAAKAGRRLVVIAIWLFAITVAYPYVPGANTEAFKGVSVFVGLVLSLGSVGVVGQIMGGLFVTFNRSLRPGDVVKVGNVYGVVKELGLVSVTVSTRTKEEVTIPNSVLVADAIRNYSRVPGGAIVLSTSVTIGYDTPWRQVRALMLLAAARTEGVLREPAPVVYETALSDFFVEYELVAHGTATVPRPALMSRLHEQILDVFNEHGVQIMSPHFEGQPEKPAVVERSQWFAAPAAKAEAHDR